MEIKVIEENCPCTKDCIRHGDCKACRAHHADMDNVSPCER